MWIKACVGAIVNTENVCSIFKIGKVDGFVVNAFCIDDGDGDAGITLFHGSEAQANAYMKNLSRFLGAVKIDIND